MGLFTLSLSVTLPLHPPRCILAVMEMVLVNDFEFGFGLANLGFD